MKNENQFDLLTTFYRTLANDTRIRILMLLLRNDLSCRKISNTLDLEYSLIAHQLVILKRNKFVKSERKGKEVIYSLDDEHIRNILNYSINHIEEHLKYK